MRCDGSITSGLRRSISLDHDCGRHHDSVSEVPSSEIAAILALLPSVGVSPRRPFARRGGQVVSDRKNHGSPRPLNSPMARWAKLVWFLGLGWEMGELVILRQPPNHNTIKEYQG